MNLLLVMLVTCYWHKTGSLDVCVGHAVLCCQKGRGGWLRAWRGAGSVWCPGVICKSDCHRLGLGATRSFFIVG